MLAKETNGRPSEHLRNLKSTLPIERMNSKSFIDQFGMLSRESPSSGDSIKSNDTGRTEWQSFISHTNSQESLPVRRKSSFTETDSDDNSESHQDKKIRSQFNRSDEDKARVASSNCWRNGLPKQYFSADDTIELRDVRNYQHFYRYKMFIESTVATLSQPLNQLSKIIEENGEDELSFVQFAINADCDVSWSNFGF